jgi:DNA-binding transcriptional LysR family regulator
MRSSFPPLSALLAFEYSARHESFKLAAQALSLTPSAISHQIANLEDLLQVKLFHRVGRQISLTSAGHEYLRRLSGALDSISTATDNARLGLSDSLAVHVSPSFATLWLMPRLADFARQHPHVALSLSSSVTHSDFDNSPIDIDIRYGRPHWPQLQIEPIFEEPICPMASPQFLQQFPIESAAALLRAPLIQSMVNIVQWRDWFISRGIHDSPDRFAYRFDRSAMAMEAAVQGLGVALDSARIAEPHLTAGRLQAVFKPDWSMKVHGHFLVFPARHLQRQAVQQFIEWVHQHAATKSS